jgi:hypothetical protein
VEPATPLRLTARRSPENRLSYSGLRTYPKRMTMPHCLSIRLRVATPRIGTFAGSGTLLDNVRHAAVAPPIPLLLSEETAIFFQHRNGAAARQNQTKQPQTENGASANARPHRQPSRTGRGDRCDEIMRFYRRA